MIYIYMKACKCWYLTEKVQQQDIVTVHNKIKCKQFSTITR